jgi:hypothetical protein
MGLLLSTSFPDTPSGVRFQLSSQTMARNNGQIFRQGTNGGGHAPNCECNKTNALELKVAIFEPWVPIMFVNWVICGRRFHFIVAS